MRLSDRRGRLERLLEPDYTGLQLITQTRAIDELEDWLKLVPGLEGVVAKRCDRPYLGRASVDQGQEATHFGLRRYRHRRRQELPVAGPRSASRGCAVSPPRTQRGCHLSSSVDAASALDACYSLFRRKRSQEQLSAFEMRRRISARYVSSLASRLTRFLIREVQIVIVP